MQFHLFHPNVDLTEEQQTTITEKIEHLAKYCERIGDDSTSVRVDIEPNKVKTDDKHVSFQATLFVPHAVLRAEVEAVTVEEALDLAFEKLQKQVERYKGKQHRRGPKGEWIPVSTLEAISEEHTAEAEVTHVTKRKLFENAYPLHEEEALEQLELLGHQWFMFQNLTTGRFAVVYKREDGTYGIAELS